MPRGSLTGEQRDKGAGRLSEEVMAKTFSHVMKYMNINIQEAQ